MGKALGLVLGMAALAPSASSILSPGPAGRHSPGESSRVTERNAQEVLVLEVSAGGAIESDGELLHDPEDSDGLLALRAWLAAAVDRVRSSSRDLPVLEPSVRIRCAGAAPFEPVQSILESCRHPTVAIELVRLEVSGEELEAPLALDPSRDMDDEEVLRLRIEARESDGERTVSYVLGSEEVGGLGEALERAAGRDAGRRFAIDPRRGTSAAEIGAVMEAAIEAGFEELACVPAWWALFQRAVERWGHVTAGEWNEVYESMTPERRRGESKEQFLEGKELHDYENVTELRVLSLRGDLAFVTLRVEWTPLHPEIIGTGVPSDLTEALELVEIWRWIEGEWFWESIRRRQDFLGEHPELAAEIEER